jgi:hypothetical protein
MSTPAETHVPLELVRFKLTADDIKELVAQRDEWRAGSREERRKIAGEVYNGLKKKNPQWTEADRKLKKEVSPLLRLSSWLKYG